jgi:hypothetical protein
MSVVWNIYNIIYNNIYKAWSLSYISLVKFKTTSGNIRNPDTLSHNICHTPSSFLICKIVSAKKHRDVKERTLCI